MAYQLINKLEQFSFQHGAMLSCTKKGGDVTLEIDGAVARHNNDYNNRFVDTYISTLSLQLFHAEVKDLCLEGYQYYDADGNFMEEVPDKPLEPDDVNQVMALCEGGYIAASDYSESGDGKFQIQFQVDATDSNDTYCVTFCFEKSSSVWERFLQKAEEVSLY